MTGASESRSRTKLQQGQSGLRRRTRLVRLAATLAATLGVIVLIAGCGGSSNSTSYWRVNLTDGQSLYMSVVTNGQTVSGWAKYEDSSWQPYTGTVDSDGTYSADAYTGVTLSVNGSAMTMTYDDGAGTWHWASTSQSQFQSAGGTVSNSGS